MRIPGLSRRCGLLVSTLLSILVAQADEIIPLWVEGAPGSEARRHEPETAQDWWVKNIHNPSITVFRPLPENDTGAAVVIFPGGGHREVVFNPEGREPAEYFASIGVTAFAVKYRLAREEGSAYDLQIHPVADARRAMRLVRARAADFGIDPARIGILGFSAGGELAAAVAYGEFSGDPAATDPIDRVSCRPDFHLSIYPGPFGFPTGKLNADTPPTFFLCAMDDTFHVQPILSIIPKYLALDIPVEVHLYAQGGHGFNMGNRSALKSIRQFPDRMADWLYDSGWLKKP
jgi:acetyl esterase/lipase